MSSKIFKLQTLLLFFYFNSFSQTFQWANELGNDGLGSAIINTSKTDAQKNVYVAGKISNTVNFDLNNGWHFVSGSNASAVVSNFNGFVAKYDSLGSLIWAKPIGGLGGPTNITDLALDQSGNIIISGAFRDSAQLDNNNPNVYVYETGTNTAGDAFLAKYDANMNYQWSFVTTGASNVQFDKLFCDDQDNIILAGSFNNTFDIDPSPASSYMLEANQTLSPSASDAFLAKYTPNGNFLWAHQLGGQLSDIAKAICVDQNNCINLLGDYKMTVYFDVSTFAFTATQNTSAGYTTAISRFSPSGTLLWHKPITSFNSGVYINGNDITIDNQNNMLITGILNGQIYFQSPSISISSSSTSFCMYLAKIDTSGTCVWAKGSYSSKITPASIAINHNTNDIFLTGIFLGAADFDLNAGTSLITSSPSTSNNYFISSYNNIGNYRWAYSLAATGTSEIVADVDGNVWVDGVFNGTLDFLPGTGTFNLTVPTSTSFLTKYRPSGTFANAFALKGCGSTKERITAIQSNDLNQVYVTGVFTGDVDFDPSANYNVLSATTDSSSYIAQYDTTGNLNWAKLIDGKVGIKSMVIDTLSNIYITGSFIGVVDFDPSPAINSLNSQSSTKTNIFIAKYDSSGNLLWANNIGANLEDDAGNNISLNDNGEIIVTGFFAGTVDFDPSTSGTFTLTSTIFAFSSVNSKDIFVAKYDNDGNFIWAFKVGGSATDVGTNVVVNNFQEIIVAGFFGTAADFNPSPTVTNTLVAAGPLTNVADYYIAKYDNNGNYMWAFRIGNNNDDYYALDLKVDNNNNIFIAGRFASTADSVDMDPSANVQNLYVGSKGFVAKYNNAGNYQFAFNLGQLYSNALDVDANGNVTVTGAFFGTDDFDPSSNTYNLISNGTYDIFVARYNPLGNFISATSFGNAFHQRGNVMHLANNGAVYTGVISIGNINFDANNPQLFLNGNSATSENGYLLKLNQPQVITPLQPTALLSNSDSTFCSGTCINYEDHSQNNPSTWQWTFNGANPSTSTLQNPQNICYPTAGNYDVQLIVSNAFGVDTLLMTNFIQVNDAPLMDAGLDQTLCLGDTVVLQATGAANILWIPATGLSNAQNITTNAFPQSTITYTLTGANGGCTASDQITLTVYPLPTAPTINPFGIELGSTPASSYQWQLNGVNISGATMQTIFPAQVGDYTVVITNLYGCTATSLPYNVLVTSQNSYSIFNKDEINIYPNPTSIILNIDLPNLVGTAQIEIINLQGQIVLSETTNIKTNKINIEHLSSGIYFVSINSNNQIVNVKLVKQ